MISWNEIKSVPPIVRLIGLGIMLALITGCGNLIGLLRQGGSAGACTTPTDSLITVVQPNWREVFGCPTSDSYPVEYVWMPFEHGSMLLDRTQHAIIVFYDDGSFEQFDDTWQPDDPDSDPTLSPPPNLYQPDQGFGKIWREQPGIQERLGWATTLAITYSDISQEFLDQGVIVMSLGNGELVGLFPFNNQWGRLPVEAVPGYYGGGIPAVPIIGVVTLAVIVIIVILGLMLVFFRRNRDRD